MLGASHVITLDYCATPVGLMRDRRVQIRLFHTIPTETRISSEVYARELASALDQLPDRSAIVSHWFPKGRFRQTVGPSSRLARPASYVDRYVVAQLAARHQNADVNHLVDHGYGHLAFSLDPRRTIVTFHDGMLFKLRAGDLGAASYSRLAWFGQWLSARALSRVARVITISQASRSDLLRFTCVPPNRITVIPQGVSPAFRPVKPLLADESGDRPLGMLHVGHCGVYKNLEAILRLVPLLTQRLGRPIAFTKVGMPFTSSQAMLIAQLGIKAQVKHLGQVDGGELPGIYSAAEVLVMPSLHEGFGLPALEAMACGTPVVASNRGALPEVVGDAGLLVSPTDVDALADAVEAVVTNPSLRHYLQLHGLERARSFSWARTAEMTFQVYRSVLDSPR